MEELFRTFFLWLSRNTWLRQMVTQIPIAYQIANRFFAGETADEAIAAVQDLTQHNILRTLDILGEEVTTKEKARQARDAYLNLLNKIQTAGVVSDLSLKLTQFGLDMGVDFCVQNVGAVVAQAQKQNLFVCIDMEDSPRTDATLEVWRRLYAEYHNVGIVIQAYLYRSEDDVKELCQAGATVRLCKGAYKEPPQVAYPEKADVDASLVRLIKMMLDHTMSAPEGKKPFMAMASHDEQILAATKTYADQLGVPREAYEFQMLYGIRRDLQEQLAAEGYLVRAYIPFGAEWFPYFMRRMAERPANAWFVFNALFKESPELVGYLVLAAVGLLILLSRFKRRKS